MSSKRALLVNSGPTVSSATPSGAGVEMVNLISTSSNPPESPSSLTDIETPPILLDARHLATRAEIWAYYAYYVGNSGVTLFNFAPTAFQNLLSQAAGEAGALPFGGRMRTVNSIVFLCNGISFCIQIAIFVVLGSFADFGAWRPNILVILTIVGVAIGFGWIGVHDPDKWQTATALYIIGLIGFQTCLTFWTAAFPSLARNTPELLREAEKYNTGLIDQQEFLRCDSLKRNELSNTSSYVSAGGEIIVCAIGVGILYAVRSRESVENNNWGLSVFIAFASGVWVILAIPWFVLEKRRPGQPIPAGKTIVTAGLWQLSRAATSIFKLRQSLAYLIGYFFLGDTLNTTVTVIQTLQNEAQAYDTIVLQYLLMTGLAAQVCGVLTYWHIQRHYRLRTKTMFNAVAVAITMLAAWGMIGAWTSHVGFHHRWEFWVYQVFYGFFVCPWWSYSQTMISEVTPPGKEFLFFSFFSIIGKASAFVGPVVSSAIVDASGNTSAAFYFLTGLSAVSALGIVLFVDIDQSKIEQERFLAAEAKARERCAAA